MNTRTLIKETTDQILENTTERIIPENEVMNRYATVLLLRDKFFIDPELDPITLLRFRLAFRQELRNI